LFCVLSSVVRAFPMRVLFFVGPMKTGSSHVLSYLAHHAHFFARRSGWIWLPTPGPTTTFHGVSLLNPKKFSEFGSAVRRPDLETYGNHSRDAVLDFFRRELACVASERHRGRIVGAVFGNEQVLPLPCVFFRAAARPLTAAAPLFPPRSMGTTRACRRT